MANALSTWPRALESCSRSVCTSWPVVSRPQWRPGAARRRFIESQCEVTDEGEMEWALPLALYPGWAATTLSMFDSAGRDSCLAKLLVASEVIGCAPASGKAGPWRRAETTAVRYLKSSQSPLVLWLLPGWSAVMPWVAPTDLMGAPAGLTRWSWFRLLASHRFGFVCRESHRSS